MTINPVFTTEPMGQTESTAELVLFTSVNGMHYSCVEDVGWYLPVLYVDKHKNSERKVGLLPYMF